MFHPTPLSYFFFHANSCTHFDSLAALLSTFCALEHVDLSQNDLSRHGVERLAALLHTGTALTSLHMTNCARNDSHSHSLASGLGRCSRLVRLSLTYNFMHDGGVGRYAHHLQRGALVRLDLSGNKIFDGGAEALARALPLYSTLQQLLLQHNNIGFPGAAALLQHSAECPTLALLDLSSNVIGRVSPARLHPAVHRFYAGRLQATAPRDIEAVLVAARGSALHRLNLTDNHLTDAEKRDLLAAWGASRGGLVLHE
jgi:Ran GTPase-activating protein (RanGAP) involved in mRNA processing and transport